MWSQSIQSTFLSLLLLTVTPSHAHPAAAPSHSSWGRLLSSSRSLLDCSNIVIEKQRFNLTSLGGRHSAHSVTPSLPGRPGVHNVTFTVDICQPLTQVDGVEPEYQCPNGTRVCGVDETHYKSGHSAITHVFPIAGEFDDRTDTLTPHWSLLKHHKDASSKDGIRLDISGGVDRAGSGPGVVQMAVIDFVCDAEIEGDDADVDGQKAGDDDDKKDKDDQKDGSDRPDKGRSLQFVSYQEEFQDPIVKVLRLEWKTKHVCPNRPGGSVPSESWGFFTWLIIIGFLGTAAYLIFSAFSTTGTLTLSCERLPHVDVLSEIGYFVKELARRAIDWVQSRSSGGYSSI